MKQITPILLLLFVASFANAQTAPATTKKTMAPAPTKITLIQKGWFGIGLQAATAEEQKSLNVSKPVPKVIRIFAGSPAENSGVKVGEYVTRFDKRDVLSTQDLVTRVGAKKPGTEVEIELRLPASAPNKKATVRVVNVVLDLRPDMRALQRNQWLGKPFPNVNVEQVSPATGTFKVAPPKNKQVMVVDYFATWCGPCQRVFPVLTALQEKYKAHGLKVIAVSAEEPTVLKAFLNRTPMNYVVSSDKAGEFRQALWVNVLPTLWVVGKDGKIRNVLFGAGHGPKLESYVREALGLPAATEPNSTTETPAPGKKPLKRPEEPAER